MFCVRNLLSVSLDIQLFKGRQRYKKLRSLSSVSLLNIYGLWNGCKFGGLAVFKMKT